MPAASIPFSSMQGGPVIADLLLYGAAFGIVLTGSFQSFAQDVVVSSISKPPPVLQYTWSAGIGLAAIHLLQEYL